MRGPYGKGFPYLSPTNRVLLIGGGTGIAPLMMAGMRERAKVNRAFFGFASQIEDWFLNELVHDVPACRVVIDPQGQTGEVVRVLATEMKFESIISDQVKVFVCGPDRMMQAVVKQLTEIVPHQQIYIGREDIMRCGIGICGSCGTQSGHRSCVDGPVMHPE